MRSRGCAGASNVKRHSERRQPLTQAIPLASRPRCTAHPPSGTTPLRHQFSITFTICLPPHPGTAPGQRHAYLIAASQIGQRCQVLDAEAGAARCLSSVR